METREAVRGIVAAALAEAGDEDPFADGESLVVGGEVIDFTSRSKPDANYRLHRIDPLVTKRLPRGTGYCLVSSRSYIVKSAASRARRTAAWRAVAASTPCIASIMWAAASGDTEASLALSCAAKL